MKPKGGVALFERQSAILERIAKKYPESSAEYGAIRQAAIALFYALTGQSGDFLSFQERWDSELSAEQEAHLRSMGVDPDFDPDSPDVKERDTNSPARRKAKGRRKS